MAASTQGGMLEWHARCASYKMQYTGNTADTFILLIVRIKEYRVIISLFMDNFFFFWPVAAFKKLLNSRMACCML